MNYAERAFYYNRVRSADVRLTEMLMQLLDLRPGNKVGDIGAGTGNYAMQLQDLGFQVYAIEPQPSMSQCCKDDRIKWINGAAESIALPSRMLDGAVVINAIHHFRDLGNALIEIYRVLGVGPLIVFTFDPEIAKRLWIFDYWPELSEYEENTYLAMPKIKAAIEAVFAAPVEEHAFDIPEDFHDVFTAAAWKRPHLLVDEENRRAMSFFSAANREVIDRGAKLLAADLASGFWSTKYSELLVKNRFDVGARLLRVNKVEYGCF